MSRSRSALLILLAALAYAVPAHAQSSAGFVAEVYAPQHPERFGRIATWFRDSNFLGQIGAQLNPYVALPRPVRLAAAECGEVNAFFRPDPSTPAVVICYEMLEAIQQSFLNRLQEGEDFAQVQSDVLEFVLSHEIGHALVHELQLPITGREEDVADQFATALFAAEHPDLPLYAARFFGATGGQPVDATAFADEHALDQQRFFNLICWTYGAAPQERSELLELLPQGRAARCPAEFQQIMTAWRTLLASHGRTAAGAPSTPAQPTPAAGSTALAGAWSYREHLALAGTDLACHNQGTLSLQAGGGSFQRTGQCSAYGQTSDNGAQGALAALVMSESRIHFLIAACEYNGTLVSAVPARVEGMVDCRNNSNGQVVEVHGTWVAER